MSSKNKYGKFKKKDYIRMVENVVWYLTRKFGYKKRPYIYETKLPKDILMGFIFKNGAGVIYYDYMQFKETFGHRDFDTQEAYAAAITAHEMRHYYQYRQILAKKPKEDEATIALWRENESHSKQLDNGEALSEFLLQPLELDASLFEYVFAAEIFEVLLIQAIHDEEHFDAMEKLYIEYFGETDSELFSDEVREILSKRKKT